MSCGRKERAPPSEPPDWWPQALGRTGPANEGAGRDVKVGEVVGGEEPHAKPLAAEQIANQSSSADLDLTTGALPTIGNGTPFEQGLFARQEVEGQVGGCLTVMSRAPALELRLLDRVWASSLAMAATKTEENLT